MNEIERMLEELKADENLNKQFEFNSRPAELNKNKGFLLAAADCETDPFGVRDNSGQLQDVTPFSWGITIETGEYYYFWGDDATPQFLKFLAEYPNRLEIFAHNGGKFDWIFLLRLGVLCGEPRIINGRIVDSMILDGRHKIRDSYAILPVPLSQLGDGKEDKLDIDYQLMRREFREEHKDEILKYLKRDCTVLLKVVQKFIEEFGNKLTIGSAALTKLKEFHPFDKIDEESDTTIRPYYIGGRVQCFQLGEIKQEIKIYDVNSMYPCVMEREQHATFVDHVVIKNPELNMLDSNGYLRGERHPYFITVVGYFTGEHGHFPIKTKQGLDFTQKRGEFKITHHELICALKHHQFVIEEIKELIVCPNTINFKEFVNKYIEDKIRYSREDNPAMRLFTKLVLNSSYGKFGQNPNNFSDFMFLEPWDEFTAEAMNEEILEVSEDLALWRLKESNDIYALYEKKLDDVESAFNDCFVAASITGASRALLMDAIITADSPVYCDTDSLACRELHESTPLDPDELGAWDLEAVGDAMYIYGKKVYALYKDGKPFTDKKGKEKTANKGVRMDAKDIYNLVTGENLVYSEAKGCKVFRWENEAPSYSLDGGYKFIARELVHKKV